MGYTDSMTPPTSHALAIRSAIARNSSVELGQALFEARQAQDVSWQTEVVEGFTCWSRVLACRKRAHLWLPLRMAGASAAHPIAFAGKQKLPLEVAVRQGNWPLFSQLLRSGAPLGSADHAPGIFWSLTKRWFGRSRNASVPVGLGTWREKQRKQAEWEVLQQRDWAEWVDLLWGKGFRPCARTLSAWMLHLDKGTDYEDRRVGWVSRAWQQGVRPIPSSIEVPSMASARPAVVMLLKASDQHAPQVMPWVLDGLKHAHRSPLWLLLLRGEHDALLPNRYVHAGPPQTGDEDHPRFVRRLKDLIQCLNTAWSGHAWSAADWPSDPYKKWDDALGKFRWNPWCPASTEIVIWGLGHGLSPGRVFKTNAEQWMGVKSTDASRHRALSALFEAGLRWETVLPGTELTAAQWLESRDLKDVVLDPGSEQIRIAFREKDLAASLPAVTAKPSLGRRF